MRLPLFVHGPLSRYRFTVSLIVVIFVAALIPVSAQRQSSSASNHNSGLLTANPTSLAFGNVQLGSFATLTETLTNTGSASLTIYNDSTTGNGFALSGVTLPLTIAPGQSYTLSVDFSPTSSGSAAGTASFGYKNWKNSLNVPLTGSGTAAGQLTVSPAVLTFGNVTLGTSGSLSGTLAASGSAVTISSASSSNSQFVLSGLSLPMTLSAGQTANFTVAFTPQASGPASGTLSFLNTGSVALQSLSGTGVSPQHSVSLNWNSSTSVVVGYNVYRGSVSGGPYTKISNAIDPSTAYADTSVVGGSTYYYVTTAIDPTGTESSYSNQVTFRSRAVIATSDPSLISQSLYFATIVKHALLLTIASHLGNSYIAGNVNPL
jgi:hypothetical protein